MSHVLHARHKSYVLMFYIHFEQMFSKIFNERYEYTSIFIVILCFKKIAESKKQSSYEPEVLKRC